MRVKNEREWEIYALSFFFSFSFFFLMKLNFIEKTFKGNR